MLASWRGKATPARGVDHLYVSLLQSEEGTRSLAVFDDFVSSPEGLRLVQAFLRVESVEIRRRIVALVQSIASHDRHLDG